MRDFLTGRVFKFMSLADPGGADVSIGNGQGWYWIADGEVFTVVESRPWQHTQGAEPVAAFLDLLTKDGVLIKNVWYPYDEQGRTWTMEPV